MARASVLFRVLVGLFLFTQAIVGPAQPSVRAQATATVDFTCGESTVSPCTVPVGGQIVVSGAFFPVEHCREEASVRISLVPTSGGALIALGETFFSSCNIELGGFFRFPPGSGTFTLPTSGTGAVPAGTYHAHASVVGFDFTRQSRNILTVGSAPESGTITGVARCDVPPATLLPFARVSVFSGSALVHSTTAGADGKYTIAGTAPQATYTIRFQPQEGSTPTCGTSVTTNSDGFAEAQDPPRCPNPDRNNRTWLTPALVGTNANGVDIVDAICAAGQSRWFRVAIKPGQQVSAEVLDPAFDVTLAMFRDISQVAAEMNAEAAKPGGLTLEDLRRFTASIPRDVAAPDIASPDIASPDIASPDIASPDIASPDIASPDIASPDIASPDIASPDIASPDIASPDIASPDAYSAAQSQSILAYSDKPGPTSEFVRRHTWDNTGFFYVRVRGHNDAYAETQPFTLRITVVNRDCLNGDGGQFNLTTTAPTFTGLPSSTPRTLILTNTARFPAGSDTAGLIASLNAFASRREVGGAVVDLAKDAGLAANYTQWDNIPDCVPAANIVAEQIGAIEARVRAQNPTNLQYIVLVGGDHVIPFVRLPDQASLANERDYSPAVLDFTPSQASLKTGYFLSQDPYGSFSRISLRDHITPSYDVPVGRLVETVSDVQTMLAAYTATNGVLRPTRALVTGYDFLADAAAVQLKDLQDSGLTVDTLIQPEGQGPKAPTAWTADQLRGLLLGADRYGILDVNAHFSGNSLVAADFETRILSREIAAVTDQRFLNTLILSMGCHSGYNIVDPEATPGTQPVDWGQAFARQGATVIGGTGYQYGNSPLIKYSEVLLSNVQRQLRYYDGEIPGNVSLGRAIVEAKRDYVRGLMNGIDEKSVAELTLYGLPMMAVNFTSGRIARPTAPPLVPTTPGTSPGLSFANLSPAYTLTGHDRVLNLVGGGTTTATYFDATVGSASPDTLTIPGRPVEPRVVTNVQASNTVARGAIMLSATYTDLTSSLGGANQFRPLVDAAWTEARGIRPSFASSVFAPTQLVTLNNQQGQFLVERPFQFKSNGNSVFGTGRRYDTLATRLYYSNNLGPGALAASPVIYTTKLASDGPTRLLIDVTVGAADNPGIEDVFATFTADKTEPANTIYGHWASVRLTPASGLIDTGAGFIRHYTGVIDTVRTGATPQSLQLIIQAVGGNGLVSIGTNNGSHHRLVTENATLGAPKLTTKLAFQHPVSAPFNATYRELLPASARLVNAVTGLPIAGKMLTFSLGTTLANATTNVNGVASVEIPVLVAPNVPLPRISATFAEDAQYLGSSDRRDVLVARAPTAFVGAAPAALPYGSAANIATLFATLSSGNKPLHEVGVRISLPDGRFIDTLSDGFGQVLFDTSDFQGVQPGSYNVTLQYGGNERYLPTTRSQTITVTGSGNRSLALDGRGFAEVPHAAELNAVHDWTFELWFKDEHANGFHHENAWLIEKGDWQRNGESPYFAYISYRYLVVGQRVDWSNRAIYLNMDALGLDPRQWHHLAATFQRSSRTLTVFVNGKQVAQEKLTATSSGNNFPISFGRSGPISAKEYFKGKLDDVRIWKGIRTPEQIAANYQRELSAPVSCASVAPCLIANWQFNEKTGTLFAFSTVGGHTAVLSTTGASFSSETHP